MTVAMWDLAMADENRRPSPFCWRTRLALLHKGVEFETIPWRFTEKDRIAFSGQGKVPVLVDEGRTVVDSWAIAEYLEEAYPDRPSLFPAAAPKPLARFVADWTAATVMTGLFPIIALAIHDHAHEKDRPYFRKSREKFVGKTLEEFTHAAEARLPEFRKSLHPLRAAVTRQPFIAGEAPAWADYAAFSCFQWARVVSPARVLEEDDPVHAWRERMLDAHGGEARRAVGYEV